ncbi:unnamed protein product [Symbiodinium microadriaticum]|nr:unnamed protein product [Symbiodinium microadriaticum]
MPQSQLQQNLSELQALQHELSWSDRPVSPVESLSRNASKWLKHRRRPLPVGAPAPGALGALLGVPHPGDGSAPTLEGPQQDAGLRALESLAKAASSQSQIAKASGHRAAKATMAVSSLPAAAPAVVAQRPRARGGHQRLGSFL